MISWLLSHHFGWDTLNMSCQDGGHNQSYRKHADPNSERIGETNNSLSNKQMWVLNLSWYWIYLHVWFHQNVLSSCNYIIYLNQRSSGCFISLSCTKTTKSNGKLQPDPFFCVGFSWGQDHFYIFFPMFFFHAKNPKNQRRYKSALHRSQKMNYCNSKSPCKIGCFGR